MYNLILLVYELCIRIASNFSEKISKMWQGECDAFRVLKEQVDPAAEYVWFHAASLGEFEQGRPIMEEYKRLHPQVKILLTFFSPSGYEVRKNYEGADVICYLPIDTAGNAKRFLTLVKPTKVFFIKYEFWYNYLSILRDRHVPTYSVSSIFRQNQIFFRWYGNQYRNVLKCFTHFFVQNEESRRLLETIGLTNVTISGDTRFDRVLQIASQSKQIDEVEWFKNGQRTFIAGSSWQPDEEIFLPYLAQHKDWKVIIAPHVIAENHLAQIMQLLQGRKVLRLTKVKEQLQGVDPQDNAARSSIVEELKSAEVLIIDCFGLLSSIYKYGEVAYVGGGFGVGIHNLPEAAVWNIPVIFGPNHQKFQEAHELKACKGGFAINGAEDFRVLMDDFIASPEKLKEAADNAGAYVKSRSGATEALFRVVNP